MAALLASVPSQAAAPAYQPLVVNPDLVGGGFFGGAGDGVFLVWGSDATILRSTDGTTWQHALSPGSADLASLAANSQASVFIAVGARGFILRSVDTGRTWASVKSPVDADLLAVTHAGERTWIAAGARGRILRSLDDGKTWKVVESKLDAALRALHFDATGSRVFIGGDQGLIGYSKDGGQSWQLTAITMPEPVTPILAIHRPDKLLLATSGLGRFLVSFDEGESWDLLQSSSQAAFTDVIHDPDHDAIVLTGHNGDVLRSTDGGRSWEGGEVHIGGRKRFLNSIEYDPRHRALLVVGGAGLISRSTDGGVTWTADTRDLRGELRGLVAGPHGGFVTFGSGGQVASNTGSQAWKYSREPLEHSLREVLATPGGDALIATSRLGDVLRSVDAGASWRPVTPNYPNENTPPDLRGLIVAPSGDAMIAVGPPGAILRGDAQGMDWRVVAWNEIEAERAYPWVLADRNRKLLMAVDSRGAMMLSRDAGLQWQRRDVAVPFEPGKFPLWQGSVLEGAGVMLVAGESGRAARSVDGGDTWRLLETGSTANFYGSFADERTGQLFLAGSRGTILRSADQGETWQAAATGSDQELRRIMRDPRSNALLCFGTHGTLLRSQDDGRHWRAVASGTDGVLRKPMMEPVTGHLLVAGSQGALLRSTDGGRSWQTLDTHTARHFNSIAADPRTGDLVLVGERVVRLVRQSARN